MYFDLHPHIEFDDTVVVDMFRRVIPHKNIIDNYAVLTTYDIQDGDTPENLSYNLYGNAEYHWVILLINDMVNMRKDWPLNQRELGDYITSKYPDPYGVHHYEDEDGDIVDGPTLYIVKNFAYEEKINEAKSKIKVLKPEFMSVFIKNFRSLIA